VAAVLGPLTVAELIQLGLGAPAAVKNLLDVIEEVRALNLKPSDAVPPAHAERVFAALSGLSLPATVGESDPSPGNFAEGGRSL